MDWRNYLPGGKKYDPAPDIPKSSPAEKSRERTTRQRVNVPKSNNKWRVHIESIQETVHVCPSNMYSTRTGVYVYPPTFLEKIRGISFEDKVLKAKFDCQKKCDIMNTAKAEAENIANKIEKNDYQKTN